jgi:hypothetical protein
MSSVRSVTTMTGRDNGVHDFFEEGPGLLISSNETASFNHRVTLVINSGLDAVAKVNTECGLSVLKLSVQRRILLEDISQEVTVSTEVR